MAVAELVHSIPAAEPPRLWDEFERALMETRALIEETVTRHRERAARYPLVATLDPHEVAIPDAARRLYAQATVSVDVLLGGDRAHASSVCAALAETAAEARPTVPVRVLFSHTALDSRLVAARAGGGWAPEIRVARTPAVEAVIVDGRKALVRSSPDLDRRATVVRAVPVVLAFHGLFDHVWRQAVPLSERIDLGDPARTRFAAQILRRLCAGRTDEVVARELNVSVRTYRRYVAEIMEILGATSRFQAGVRAAELGLCTFGADGGVRPRAMAFRTVR